MLRTLKDTLSSKTTTTVDGLQRSRLPPINHSTSNGATSPRALPPIGSSQSQPPPPVESKPRSENTTANGSSPPPTDSKENEQTTSFINTDNSAASSQPPPSYAYVATNSVAQAGSFQTSNSRGYIPPSSQLSTRHQANLERAIHIEQSGIRTYPICAILSAFLCNPPCGIIAAVLTLIATHSYYNKNFLAARNTAVAANVFIFLAIALGIITYIVLISVAAT